MAEVLTDRFVNKLTEVVPASTVTDTGVQQLAEDLELEPTTTAGLLTDQLQVKSAIGPVAMLAVGGLALFLIFGQRRKR